MESTHKDGAAHSTFLPQVRVAWRSVEVILSIVFYEPEIATIEVLRRILAPRILLLAAATLATDVALADHVVLLTTGSQGKRPRLVIGNKAYIKLHED
jgi:hypothetical protein